MDIPLIDADGMGRAYPEVQMLSFFVYGEKGTPCALADEKGYRMLLLDVPNDSVKNIEDIVR